MELSERFRGFLPVVVDVETAGVSATRHALLELAVVTLDWIDDSLQHKSTSTWSIAPHESTEVDTESLNFNQIDPYDPQRIAQPEDVCIRECFRLVRKELRENNCKRALLTGHNAHFDRQFLKAAQDRNSIGRDPFHPFTVLDTASLSMLTFGHSVLRIACDRAGVKYDSERAHSATYDAVVTAELFCNIMNRSDFKPIWPTEY
ncbi:MAG: ribonuclease T [Gammaproteobacteria bacterium]|nr:ribonuclease T [Gammaproteobacteria bacterium]MYD79541.1 ribonuclease T [Gammaproteobacteria bacterium]